MKLKHAAVAIAAFVLWAAPAKAEGISIPPAAVPEDIAKGPTKADVWTGFYVEGGLGLMSSNIDAQVITLGDTSYTGHLGIGADWMFSPHWVAGVWGRVHINDLSFSAFGTKLADTSVYYSIGGRLGFVPRDDWMLYGLVGYRFSSLDTIAGVPDIDTNAWLVGGGLEVMLTDNWFLGVEGVAALGQSETLGPVKIDATDYSGTVRLGFKF